MTDACGNAVNGDGTTTPPTPAASGGGIFIDNQVDAGWCSTGSHSAPSQGLCGMAATGMVHRPGAGLRAPPQFAPGEACRRIAPSCSTPGPPPHDQGILPHFIDAVSSASSAGIRSAIDSAWLFAGALGWRIPSGCRTQDLARRLLTAWTGNTTPTPAGLGFCNTGRTPGALLPALGPPERRTIFMYVLAPAEEASHPTPCSAPQQLFRDRRRASLHADLGLFVFQYGFT